MVFGVFCSKLQQKSQSNECEEEYRFASNQDCHFKGKGNGSKLLNHHWGVLSDIVHTYSSQMLLPGGSLIDNYTFIQERFHFRLDFISQSP